MPIVQDDCSIVFRSSIHEAGETTRVNTKRTNPVEKFGLYPE